MDVSLPFVKVINVNFDDKTRSIVSSIPWKSITVTLYQESSVHPPKVTTGIKKKRKVSSNTTKRQHYHKDVGYTSGVCLTDKDELGISVPVTKPANDVDHVQAMVALSSLLKLHVFNDLKDTIFFDAVNLDRVSNFGQTFDSKNMLEALRSAISNVQHPCGCHEDGQNDTHPHFSTVITFSMFVIINGTIFRLALIGYSRKAIRDYYDRHNQPEAKLVQKIRKVLKSLPTSRLGWCESVRMINGQPFENTYPRQGSEELGFVLDRCHMNVYCYLSSWIYFASKLITQFSLTYEESVGLVLGMYCNNTPISFSCVATDLLEQTDNVAKISLMNFGLTVRKKMYHKKKATKERFGQDFTFPQ